MMNNILLDIQPHESKLMYLSNIVVLPIGTNSLNGFSFQHSPITPYEAEIAIEHIENIIIPARKQFSLDEIMLSSRDQKLSILWNAVGKIENFLTTEQIESAFNQLINVINGSPIHSTQLPTDKSFSAFLLILREITHHWGLSGIHIK